MTINVSQVTPTINWSTPAAITYGTALSATQLNATSTMPGTFAYTPASGTVLNPGRSQTLSVTLTPTDTTDYTTATSTVQLTVNQAQCVSSGYSYQRAITIDPRRFLNTDETNFPFLFNTTDPAFATIANGGHVTSSTGNDIIFSTDPNGLTSCTMNWRNTTRSPGRSSRGFAFRCSHIRQHGSLRLLRKRQHYRLAAEPDRRVGQQLHGGLARCQQWRSTLSCRQHQQRK